MLADSSTPAQSGQFPPEIQLPETARHELLKFIADELPRWRDDPDREFEAAEPTLTRQLCSYLNSAAKNSRAWSGIQFGTELQDEKRADRKIDLAPLPCEAPIIIGVVRLTKYKMIFPIECKRLPTPKRANRDKREYVVTRNSTTGGIQRFKFGFHGSEHRMGAMIGYIQEESSEYWQTQVNKWIVELSADMNSGWSASDSLDLVTADPTKKVSTLHSCHKRNGQLEDIELEHLWIELT